MDSRERESERERERVREGERSFCERNPNPWIMAKSRRRSKVSPPMAVRTCFVNFLPLNISQKELAHIFAQYGEVARIIIPGMNLSNRQYRYAFIKFFAQSAFQRAIKGENGRQIGNLHMRVYPAKHDMNIPNPEKHSKRQTTNSHRPTLKFTKMNPLNRVRDHRSYKAVTLNQNHPILNSLNQASPNPKRQSAQANPSTPNPTNPNPNPSQPDYHPQNHQIPPLEPEPQPKCFKFEPTMVRKVSSRILGEDTEKVRDELYICTFEEEEFITIKGSKNSDMDELLNRSVIATAQSSLSSNCILDHILTEGVTCLSIKPMGGLLHLVTFETIEDKNAMIESEWLSRWFMDIRNVNSMSSSKWRESHLKIYGMPLHGWGYENFYNVGCIFGRVTSVDYSSFEYAKITVITDCLFSINCKLVIEVEDKSHKICVSEDLQHSLRNFQNTEIPSAIPITSDSDEEASETHSPLHDREITPPIPHIFQDGSTNNYLEQPFPNHSLINSSPKSQTIIGNSKSPPSNVPAMSEKNFSPPIVSLDLLQDSSKISQTNKIIQTPPINHPPSADIVPSPNKKISSPISISNRFGALLRPNNTSKSSSFSSGPLFPPGFEDEIPLNIRVSHAIKKAKKKKDRKALNRQKNLESLNPKSPEPTLSSPSSPSITLSASDILSLAEKIGLSFDGPMETLLLRIENILKRQRSDWLNSS